MSGRGEWGWGLVIPNQLSWYYLRPPEPLDPEHGSMSRVLSMDLGSKFLVQIPSLLIYFFGFGGLSKVTFEFAAWGNSCEASRVDRKKKSSKICHQSPFDL